MSNVRMRTMSDMEWLFWMKGMESKPLLDEVAEDLTKREKDFYERKYVLYGFELPHTFDLNEYIEKLQERFGFMCVPLAADHTCEEFLISGKAISPATDFWSEKIFAIPSDEIEYICRGKYLDQSRSIEWIDWPVFVIGKLSKACSMLMTNPKYPELLRTQMKYFIYLGIRTVLLDWTYSEESMEIMHRLVLELLGIQQAALKKNIRQSQNTQHRMTTFILKLSLGNDAAKVLECFKDLQRAWNDQDKRSRKVKMGLRRAQVVSISTDKDVIFTENIGLNITKPSTKDLYFQVGLQLKAGCIPDDSVVDHWIGRDRLQFLFIPTLLFREGPKPDYPIIPDEYCITILRLMDSGCLPVIECNGWQRYEMKQYRGFVHYLWKSYLNGETQIHWDLRNQRYFLHRPKLNAYGHGSRCRLSEDEL